MNLYLRILFFIIISAFFYHNITKNTIILAGDYPEYLLTTFSFYNHFSPDLRIEDVSSAKELLKNSGYENNIINLINEYSNFLGDKYKPFPHGFRGYFFSLHNNSYCYHFWFYSLLVAIFKPLSNLMFTPISCFVFVNTLFILFVIFYILFISAYKTSLKYLFSLFFFISPILYYLNWLHPEVFSASCVYLGLLVLFEKKYIFSILCFTLGSFQNPPILFLIGLVFLNYFIENKFRITLFIKYLFVSALVFVPSLFYYYNYKISNLIMYFGTDFDNISTSRFCSLFFDLSQGVIVALPLIVFIFFFFIIYNFFKIKKLDLRLLFVALSVFIISVPTMLQNNWNMGESGIIRYGVWISMPIIFYVVMFSDKNFTKLKYLFVFLFTISQITIIYLMNGPNIENWRYLHFNDFSKYIFNNHPYLYNPEPEIFCERIRHEEGLDISYSPILYKNEEGNIRKIMFHINQVDSISLKYKLDRSKFVYKRDWVYYNFN
ncbi:MAG: hypothetical protein A2X12_11395 [Bacteroidetes bacterium GWE2_29_8]|nr:MAG: hypothetical protein A2X12_11395 [Bacteroidetes bacterium GWE2_29_8]OFY23059.1 MAG: hypothetical protein A2X02_09520 [Bacteroidetes bacterium GWF2_29_10]